MAKKAKGSKKPTKSSKKQPTKQPKKQSKKQSAKKQTAKRAAEEQPKPAQPKPAKAAGRPEQVEVLKLALRDTEAKLVDAEHRLRQVQQQLDDERRALAEAAEEAIVDAEPVARPAPADPLTPPLPHRPAADVPSEEWTLVRLREEARRRGLPGVGNLPKARLVDLLTRG